MEGNADRTDGIYSIGAVARMLGIPAQTLRAWEDRYQQIVPARSGGGQRLYSRDQVDQLSFIRNQIALGMQPADAHRLLAEHHHKDAASTPVDQRRIAGASVDAATTTVLLAERDPYAARVRRILPTHRGLCGSNRARPRRGRAEILRGRSAERACRRSDDLRAATGMALCRTARDATVRSRSSPSPRCRPAMSRRWPPAPTPSSLKPLDPLQFVSTVRDLLGTSAYLQQRS